MKKTKFTLSFFKLNFLQAITIKNGAGEGT